MDDKEVSAYWYAMRLVWELQMECDVLWRRGHFLGGDGCWHERQYFLGGDGCWRECKEIVGEYNQVLGLLFAARKVLIDLESVLSEPTIPEIVNPYNKKNWDRRC